MFLTSGDLAFMLTSAYVFQNRPCGRQAGTEWQHSWGWARTSGMALRPGMAANCIGPLKAGTVAATRLVAHAALTEDSGSPSGELEVMAATSPMRQAPSMVVGGQLRCKDRQMFQASMQA